MSDVRPRARHRWRRILLTIVAVLAIAAIAVGLIYWREVAAIRDRVAAGSVVVDTALGPVEYAALGNGPPVLVVHGAGGGYDQGVLTARAFLGDGFHTIAPSRFGYLRSPLPADASTLAQADAFAALLDSLGVARVALVGMSGGVPPALQFAARYPERTAALVLISSAPFTPLGVGDQALPVPAWLYRLRFATDFPFWAIQKIAPAGLDVVFDVKPGVRDSLSPDERALLDELVAAFQPVTARVAGLGNEGAAIDPAAHYDLDRIAAPTLVVHASDDGINPFAIGEYVAGHIAGSGFVPLSSGGHLLLAHQAEVRVRVSDFIRGNAAAAAADP